MFIKIKNDSNRTFDEIINTDNVTSIRAWDDDDGLKVVISFNEENWTELKYRKEGIDFGRELFKKLEQILNVVHL